VNRSFDRSFVFAALPLLAALPLAVRTSVPAAAFESSFLAHYQGKPYHDSRYQGGAQVIPGTLMCAYYDLGGEGVAYHDSDAKNNGSGALNPANGSYLNEFRMGEGVDTSYTKIGLDPKIDDNPYNKTVPSPNLLYVGWTMPGEWFNVTVEVARAGEYSADLLYTSNRGGTISIDVNGNSTTGPLIITSTFDVADPIPWRQWHHWNLATNLVKLKLPAGKSVLTVHILSEGQMNLATLDFKKVA
jgi:Carbohydrate binding module (family 6)